MNTFTHLLGWRTTLLCTATLLSLTACGGGGGGGTSDDPGTTQSVRGVLVQPQSTTAASSVIVASRGVRESAASAACPDVPDGYQPLANVTVNFLDDAATLLGSLTTDACGSFSGNVPSGATQVSATPTGFSTIEQPLSTFSSATPAVVSALPTGAELVISVLQDLGSGKLALTVSDSLTGKSVLGLGAEHFTFAAGGSATTPVGVDYGASTAQAASVAMVLDGSGSMGAMVGTTGKTRNQLASLAAHELLNGLSNGSDEAGVVLFGSGVTTVNDATLATLNWLDDAGNAAAPYTFSATGMTSTIPSLRTIADLYNTSSSIYLYRTDPVHPDTAPLHLRYPPFGGATSYFDATAAGLTLLSTARNPRRIVVALTDGQDNSSSASLDQVVAQATAAGTPLYTVGFGSSTEVNETEMQAMADATGGEYKRVEGADLTGLFQSIQTGIRFQYVAGFASAFASGTVVGTTITAYGKTVSRELTVR